MEKEVNTMSHIQTAMNNQRKKIIISLGVIFTGLWALLVAYLLTEGKKDYSVAQPGTIAVHAPSPVASTPVATVSSSRKATPLLHHSTPVAQWSYIQNTPTATMTSTSMHLHQTSNATVQNIGSGMGGGSGVSAGGGTGTSSRGIQTSGIAYSGAIYIPTTHNSVSTVGASSANEVTTSSSAAAPAAHPGLIKTAKMDDFPEFPEDQVPDEVETPIGNTPWILMILLTIGWCVRVRLRKQQ